MPLPEKWSGIFYGKETCGDFLFDMDGETFVSFVQEHPEQVPPFLAAGAVFDLTMHGYKERAEDLLVYARESWPDSPWDWLENMLKTLDEIIFQQERVLPEPIRGLISHDMQMAFCGFSIQVVPL